jgi:hypothetical protein
MNIGLRITAAGLCKNLTCFPSLNAAAKLVQKNDIRKFLYLIFEKYLEIAFLAYRKRLLMMQYPLPKSITLAPQPDRRYRLLEQVSQRIPTFLVIAAGQHFACSSNHTTRPKAIAWSMQPMTTEPRAMQIIRTIRFFAVARIAQVTWHQRMTILIII